MFRRVSRSRSRKSVVHPTALCTMRGSGTSDDVRLRYHACNSRLHSSLRGQRRHSLHSDGQRVISREARHRYQQQYPFHKFRSHSCASGRLLLHSAGCRFAHLDQRFHSCDSRESNHFRKHRRRLGHQRICQRGGLSMKYTHTHRRGARPVLAVL